MKEGPFRRLHSTHERIKTKSIQSANLASSGLGFKCSKKPTLLDDIFSADSCSPLPLPPKTRRTLKGRRGGGEGGRR